MVHPCDRISSNIVNRKRSKINYLSGGERTKLIQKSLHFVEKFKIKAIFICIQIITASWCWNYR